MSENEKEVKKELTKEQEEAAERKKTASKKFWGKVVCGLLAILM